MNKINNHLPLNRADKKYILPLMANKELQALIMGKNKKPSMAYKIFSFAVLISFGLLMAIAFYAWTHQI